MTNTDQATPTVQEVRETHSERHSLLKGDSRVTLYKLERSDAPDGYTVVLEAPTGLDSETTIIEVALFDADYRTAIDKMSEIYELMPMPTKGEISRNFIWGGVLTVHEVGLYQIVEYVHPQAANESDEDYDPSPSFHPYVNGKDTGNSFRSLDQALVSCMAYVHQSGCQLQTVVRYVSNMLEMN